MCINKRKKAFRILFRAISRSQFSREQDQSRESGPNSVRAGGTDRPDIAGAATGVVRDSPAFLGARAGFQYRDRLRDRICKGIHHNFGIKYYRMLGKSDPEPRQVPNLSERNSAAALVLVPEP
jgi:hypothetical protein